MEKMTITLTSHDQSLKNKIDRSIVKTDYSTRITKIKMTTTANDGVDLVDDVDDDDAHDNTDDIDGRDDNC